RGACLLMIANSIRLLHIFRRTLPSFSGRRDSISALVCLVACGCAPSSRPSGEVTAIVPAKEKTLTYDFGVVRPGESRTHRFRVRNTGTTPWSFRAFHRDCSCMVTRSSSATIAPGAEEEVEVSYTAPGQVADQRRRVGVEFAGPGAPFLWLEVVARV